ncbi:MAG: hypothetical protein K6G81_08485 [Lachnospiraceae bacterium]|nr:hypothetical protein [Lachnospiraceae bacterium]
MTVLLCIFLCMAVSSCTSKPKPDPGLQITESPEPTGSDTEPELTKTVQNQDKTEVITLRYYVVNGNGQLERATSLVKGGTQITPELVLDFLLDSLEDESIVLKVDGIEIKDKVCVISFDDSIYSVAASGARMENAVLDAIAQSILDNVKDVLGVSYRIKGDQYITDNNSFSVDSVYME